MITQYHALMTAFVLLGTLPALPDSDPKPPNALNAFAHKLLAADDWNTAKWRLKCQLFKRSGTFYSTAGGFHTGGAVIDAKRGVQHIFFYSGHPGGPAGVFRLTRTLDTPKLREYLKPRNRTAKPETYVLADDGSDNVTINEKDDGYRGIWYMNQPSGDEYVYKYSGGLGTYCAKHQPFAIYCPEVQRTFFCYGGTTKDNNRRLLHMVSYYDHRTKSVPRPTILLDKQTSDAHDNPVISIDDQGYIWVFSTSHGTTRPSYIHRSTQPYSIEEFERVNATRAHGTQRVAIDNFSYMQAWHIRGRGFICFFTRYGDPAKRTLMCMTSADGVNWSEWQRLAAIEEGHYQISAVGRARAGSAFNYHPQGKGLNWRTNLYYIETPDFGKSWQTVDGRPIRVPLTSAESEAIIHDYQKEGLNVYLKDISYDAQDRPVILYLTSKGYQSGPKNDPRTWTTARWTGSDWEINKAFTSDNNYDMGSLWIESDGAWRIIAPTETGPQPYNPGGEVALWLSRDQGRTWQKQRHLTRNSERNHTYVRRPVNAQRDFYGLWADGHGRQPSLSRLYFCDKDGSVTMLPRRIDAGK